MSLLKTKPHYCPTAVATESGWVNPATNELLVSVGGLKSKLAALEDSIKSTKIVEAEPVVEIVAVPVAVEPIKEEIVMNEVVEVKTRKPYAPRKPKVVGEVVDSKLPEGQQLIGEVVEYQLDTSVVGE